MRRRCRANIFATIPEGKRSKTEEVAAQQRACPRIDDCDHLLREWTKPEAVATTLREAANGVHAPRACPSLTRFFGVNGLSFAPSERPRPQLKFVSPETIKAINKFQGRMG